MLRTVTSVLSVGFALLAVGPAGAAAADSSESAASWSVSPVVRLNDDGFAPAEAPVWRVSWQVPVNDAVERPLRLRSAFDDPAFAATDSTGAAQSRPRPVAVEYSHAYEVRRTIHKWASIATVPLFAAEFAVGQSLYNNTSGSDSKRGLHSALAGSIAGLFAVNSVTGVWNLWEGRKDPNGRTRRVLHGILMLAADAGFVATGATAPDGEHGRNGTIDTSGRSRHRAIALTSMGTALASYLMMLLWRD
jgi:hypothetical protein